MIYALINSKNEVIEIFEIKKEYEEENKNILELIKKQFGNGEFIKIDEYKGFISKSYTYDRKNNNFIPPKPYDSWVWSNSLKNWVSPIPYPKIENDFSYEWDELLNNWKKVN